MSVKQVFTFTLICAGLHAGVSPDNYSARLDQLDPSRPESVCAARTALHEMLQNASDPDRAVMFRTLYPGSKE